MTAALQDAVTRCAHDTGASRCTFADLTAAHDAVHALYGPYCAGFPRAVSVAVYFPRETVQQQLDGPTRSYQYFYEVINRQLDAITLRLSNLIQDAGFRACPVPASDYRESVRATHLQTRVLQEDAVIPPPAQDLCGLFGHRLAASLSGLGWIGKNGSLINPDVGPRLRLGTVLTDAPFAPGTPLPVRCGRCTRCRDICPPGAIKGVAFDPAQPLETRLNPRACHAHLGRIQSAFGQGTCALCLAICPVGGVAARAQS